MDFGWAGDCQDLGYVGVAGLHRRCKPGVLFDPPNFRYSFYYCVFVCMYIRTYIHVYMTYTHIRMYLS